MNVTLEKNILIKIGLGIIISILTYYLWPVLILISTSFILAAILRPLQHLFVKIKIPPSFSALISILLLISFVYFILAFYLPFIFNELNNLGKIFNQSYVHQLLQTLIQKLNLHQYGLSADSVQQYILKHTLNNVEQVGTQVLSTLSEQGISILLISVKSVLVLVMTFHFLNNWSSWYNSMNNYISANLYRNITETVKKVDISITYWIKGQSLIVGLLFLYYTTSFYFLNLPYVISLAALCALSSFVPYLGAVFSALLTFLVSANMHVATPELMYGTHYIILGMVFIAGNLIESHLLVPYIIGNQLHMHPLILMIYILCFAQFFGVYGMLFSLPVILIIHITIKSFLESVRNQSYKKTFQQHRNKKALPGNIK